MRQSFQKIFLFQLVSHPYDLIIFLISFRFQKIKPTYNISYVLLCFINVDTLYMPPKTYNSGMKFSYRKYLQVKTWASSCQDSRTRTEKRMVHIIEMMIYTVCKKHWYAWCQSKLGQGDPQKGKKGFAIWTKFYTHISLSVSSYARSNTERGYWLRGLEKRPCRNIRLVQNRRSKNT
jgi:hypothetical protein